MNRKHILSLLLAAVLLCCSPFGQRAVSFAEPPAAAEASVPDAPGQRTIRIFETSDIHGYLLDTTGGEEDQFQYRLACIAQVVNEARAGGQYDDVLLVDGGDIYQGMPVWNLSMGAAMIAALDAMDYDAVALGNHEFDWGVSTYCADADTTLPAYRIGDFAGDPEIPVLACNLCFADTQERVPFTRDYVIVEKAGLRVALIGYIPDYSHTIMHEKIAPYAIHEDLSDLSRRVKEINAAEQPDVTVVMAHAIPVDVAAALSPEDVDLVTGSHKHQGIYGVAESGVPYIQGDCYAKAMPRPPSWSTGMGPYTLRICSIPPSPRIQRRFSTRRRMPVIWFPRCSPSPIRPGMRSAIKWTRCWAISILPLRRKATSVPAKPLAETGTPV